MAYQLRWRMATMVSIVCHIFFFVSAGYLSAHFVPPTIEEKILELELVSELKPETQQDHLSPIVPTTTPATPVIPSSPQTPASLAPQAQPPIAEVQSTTPTVVTSVHVAEALPMTDLPSTPASNASSPESTEKSATSTNTGKSSGFTPPTVLSKTEPAYPQSAKQAGMEGTVLLKIEILENGRSGNIQVSRSSGHALLDEAAIATVGNWRFVPAKDRNNGQSVSCYTTIPISFRLQ